MVYLDKFEENTAGNSLQLTVLPSHYLLPDRGSKPPQLHQETAKIFKTYEGLKGKVLMRAVSYNVW